eukprot:m.78763 g.78763  ORF g.78763 m.78763 type:complete len:89 (+) comp16250_c0_seq3:509-775(+)
MSNDITACILTHPSVANLVFTQTASPMHLLTSFFVYRLCCPYLQFRPQYRMRQKKEGVPFKDMEELNKTVKTMEEMQKQQRARDQAGN